MYPTFNHFAIQMICQCQCLPTVIPNSIWTKYSKVIIINSRINADCKVNIDDYKLLQRRNTAVTCSWHTQAMCPNRLFYYVNVRVHYLGLYVGNWSCVAIGNSRITTVRTAGAWSRSATAERGNWWSGRQRQSEEWEELFIKMGINVNALLNIFWVVLCVFTWYLYSPLFEGADNSPVLPAKQRRAPPFSHLLLQPRTYLQVGLGN